MLLASAVVAVVLCALLVTLACFWFRDADQALLAGERAVRRQRAWATERATFLASRERIADGVQVGAETVVFGSALTRAGHRALVSIPFGILKAIPATRERGLRAQMAHDESAERLYRGIESVSSRIAEGVRQRLTGEVAQPRELPGAEETQVLQVEFEVHDEVDP
jgi:hypothetical protein